MDWLSNLYKHYYDKTMTWYAGLTFVEQMGVLLVLFIVAFGIIAALLIKKAAGGR
jgi:hypothetical protein